MLEPLAHAWQQHARRRGNRAAPSVVRDLLNTAGPIRVAHLTPETIRKITDSWRTRYATSTASKMASTLRKLLRDLREETNEINPLARTVDRMPSAEPRPVTARSEEIKTLLGAAKPAMRLLIHLCSGSGLRIAEALSLAPANVTLETQIATFIQKGRRPRTAPLTDEAIKLIRTAPNHGPFTPLIDAIEGRAITKRAWQDRWYKLLLKTGVNKNLHIHDLRRTLATRAYALTKDIRVVQQLLGHKALSSTLHYLAPLDTQNLKPIIEQIQTESRWKQ